MRDWYGARAAALRAPTTAEWLCVLAAADIPAMPCLTHPTEGDIHGLRPTVHFDGETGQGGRAAPPIGFDKRSVLERSGLSDPEIEALLASSAAVAA